MLPLHPISVHFPIALLITSGFLWVLYLLTPHERYRTVAFSTLLIGVLGAGVAILTGLAQEDEIVHNDVIHDLMETHENIGFVVLGFFALMLLWAFRAKTTMSKAQLRVYVLLFWIGLGVLGFGAHLGGQMVYVHGAGVEPMKEVIQAAQASSPEAHQHSH